MLPGPSGGGVGPSSGAVGGSVSTACVPPASRDLERITYVATTPIATSASRIHGHSGADESAAGTGEPLCVSDVGSGVGVDD